MKKLSELTNVQRMWIDDFERTTNLPIHGDNWNNFLADEISWNEFMNNEIDEYAKIVEYDLLYLANLYHYLEKQAGKLTHD